MDGISRFHHLRREVISIILIGIDLEKSIAVYRVNEGGKAELINFKVSGEQLLPFLAHLPPSMSQGATPHW